KKEYKMKKLFYRLSSRRPFVRLFSMHARLDERRGLISCRKWFLVFVLAFAALTLGGSQEARADCDPDDWICLIFGGPVNGSYGSTVLVYDCTKGQGVSTNTLTLGNPDTFVSSGNLICDFKGQVKGNDINCSFNLTYTGELASCDDNHGAGPAVLTVKSTCDNPNVVGTLHCDSQPNNLPDNPGIFPAVTDNLGLSGTNECKKVYPDQITLFTQATFASTCPVVLTSATSASLRLKDVTKTTTQVCHGDANPLTLQPNPVDCVVQPGGTTNRAASTIPNRAQTACDASPSTWNVDCTGGTGTKDQGSG